MTMKGLVKLVTWFILGLLLTFGLDQIVRFQVIQLQDPDWFTGWLLLTGVVFLSIFQFRKKLSLLPIGKMSVWKRIHIFMGVLCGYLFLCHLGFHLPNGTLDWTLFIFFGLTFLSGLTGWYFSKTIPRQLAEVPQQILADEIPFRVNSHYKQAKQLLMDSVKATQSDTLVTFFNQRLDIFLQAPHFFWFKSRRPSRMLSQILRECQEIKRYLNTDERRCLDAFLEIAKKKDDLDYIFSGDRLLKGWMFIHIPMTYGLLLFSLVHVLLVLTFRGGGIG